MSTRMKDYEWAFSATLPARLPIVIRVDGRAFHRYTHSFDKPFDDTLRNLMAQTAVAMCRNLSGAKFAFTQSDEISVLLTNDDTLNTEPFMGNVVQKLVSISASMATQKFAESLIANDALSLGIPQFDSRVFVLPPDEVENYFLWRQLDATRNSIRMAAYAHFSHKQLLNVTNKQAQDMLFTEKGVNWNDYPIMHKRGVAVKRFETARHVACQLHGGPIRAENGDCACVDTTTMDWAPDLFTPVFSEDRDYISSTWRAGWRDT